MDRYPLPVLDLDENVEGGRRLALEDRLLGAPAARLLVGEGDALDATQEVVQGRVHEQVLERLAMGGLRGAPKTETTAQWPVAALKFRAEA